jgi:AcrR family transcriptional regulator
MAMTAADWKARPEGPEYDAMCRRLVDAAGAIMRDKGVGALRLDSVADAVGLHRSSVYRYFDSKEALITAVVVQASLRVGREVIARLGESAPPQRFLVEGLSIALAEMANDAVYTTLLAPSASESLTRITGSALTEGIRPLIEPMFVAAAERGVLRAGVTPDAAMRWLQIVASGLMRSPDPIDSDELTELLELMLVPALLEEELRH